ncbi:MAG: three-Cys-motif partner protein TcmP [Candidatus Thermoplasmatota archaeon]|nr:three-Cys-motif partner protein TcmP [Candidatus Thermoplasmatota archaeon]
MRKLGDENITPQKEKRSDRDKIFRQIQFIADEPGKNVMNALNSSGLGPNQSDNEYGPHTLLKLCYLNYYIGYFSTIANKWKQGGMFDRVIFLDAFGGSGLVKISGTNYSVLGSTVLAARNTKFDKVVAVEIDAAKARLLEGRLKVLSPGRAIVKRGDVNVLIREIVDEMITDKTIVLFFVDPEGMEPAFAELKYLMDKTRHVDIIMNFTWGVYRLNGRIMARFNDNDIRRMKSLIPTYEPGKDPTDAILKMFEDLFGKPYGDQVEIRSDKTEYSLILRVRRTRSDSSWVKSMSEFGKIINSADGRFALTLLQQAKSVQDSLF